MSLRAVEECVHSLCVDMFSSLEYISPRSGVAISYGNSKFNFLKYCQIVFQTIPAAAYEILSDTISLPALVTVFDYSYPVGEKWYLVVLLICIP